MGGTEKEKYRESTRQLPEEREGIGEKIAKGVDKGTEWIGHGMDLADSLTTTGTEIAHLASGGENDTADEIGNVQGMVSGAWGTYSGLYGTVKGSQEAREKSKKGDKRGAALAGFDIAGSIFGGASGATGFTSSLLGKHGWGEREVKGKKENPYADVLGHISAGLGLFGSTTGLAKSSYQTHTYRKLAAKRETQEGIDKMQGQYSSARDDYKSLKDKYKKDKSALSKEQKLEMLKKRHERKRSKDFKEAMMDARQQAKLKSREGIVGIVSSSISTIGGGLGLAGGLFKQFAGNNKVLKTIGLGLGIASGVAGLLAKGAELIGQKIMDRKKKTAKVDSAKKYMEDKVNKLLDKQEAKEDKITKQEAELIIARRLGVEKPTDYKAIYEKLAERRAERILRREEGYKEVLASMGLTEDADKATILEALGV